MYSLTCYLPACRHFVQAFRNATLRVITRTDLRNLTFYDSIISERVQADVCLTTSVSSWSSGCQSRCIHMNMHKRSVSQGRHFKSTPMLKTYRRRKSGSTQRRHEEEQLGATSNIASQIESVDQLLSNPVAAIPKPIGMPIFNYGAESPVFIYFLEKVAGFLFDFVELAICIDP